MPSPASSESENWHPAEALSPRPRPERPRMGCQFSNSLEAGLGKQPHNLRPDRTPLTKRHVRINVPNYSRKTSAARGYSAGRATDGTGDRAQQGLPATVLITVLVTVLPTDTRTALCYLTPVPRTKRRGRSSPGPCSLCNSRRAQLLVLRLARDPPTGPRTYCSFSASAEARLVSHPRRLRLNYPPGRLSHPFNAPECTRYVSHDWQGTATGAMGQWSNLLFTIPY